MHRKTVAEIDLAAIRQNYQLASALASNSKNIAVVKADAYGHGGVPVALELEKVAPALAVAFIDEAVELRDAGVRCPILILEGAEDAEALRYMVEHEFWVMLHGFEMLTLIERLAVAPNVWVKIDTGMHRLGIPADTVTDVVRRLRATGLEGEQLVLATHLATADDRDSEFVGCQIARLRSATSSLGLPLSIANSAGILEWPDSHAEWNRPGYMLYGNSPLRDAAATGLVPAMRLVSHLLTIHDVDEGESVGYGQRWTAQRRSRIGTVAIGYADGYPRNAANGTTMLVNSKPAPLVGTVSMDMITVDLTDAPASKVGDAVILWGPELPVDNVAQAAGTIGYELLTGVSRRVPRSYVKS